MLERVDRERRALKEAVGAAPARTGSRALRATPLLAAAAAFLLIVGGIVWNRVARPRGVSDRTSKGLQPVEPEDGNIVLRRLRWLARHQDKDGSWGRLPEGCACPIEDEDRKSVV